MEDLTITIDADVLTLARMRAREQGTDIDALIRAYVANYGKLPAAPDEMDRILDLAASSTSGSGKCRGLGTLMSGASPTTRILRRISS